MRFSPLFHWQARFLRKGPLRLENRGQFALGAWHITLIEQGQTQGHPAGQAIRPSAHARFRDAQGLGQATRSALGFSQGGKFGAARILRDPLTQPFEIGCSLSFSSLFSHR